MRWDEQERTICGLMLAVDAGDSEGVDALLEPFLHDRKTATDLVIRLAGVSLGLLDWAAGPEHTRPSLLSVAKRGCVVP